MNFRKLAAAAALVFLGTQASASSIGIFGPSGFGPGYASVLNANGHTATNLSNAQANDAAFLAGLDVVILGRTDGTAAIEGFVQGGGLLVAEWSATDWTLNDTNLLQADAQNGFSPSTFVATDTPITFTAAGLSAGLGNGLGASFSDGASTEFFWPIMNIGAGVEILATRPGGNAVIIGGASGAGNVLVMAHDWNDRAYDPADGITLNEQLLLNAVGYQAGNIAAVPLPAGLPLLLGGLGVLGLVRRKRRG